MQKTVPLTKIGFELKLNQMFIPSKINISAQTSLWEVLRSHAMKVLR